MKIFVVAAALLLSSACFADTVFVIHNGTTDYATVTVSGNEVTVVADPGDAIKIGAQFNLGFNCTGCSTTPTITNLFVNNNVAATATFPGSHQPSSISGCCDYVFDAISAGNLQNVKEIQFTFSGVGSFTDFAEHFCVSDGKGGCSVTGFTDSGPGTTPPAVPEPPSVIFFSTGLFALGFAGKRFVMG
jgi:hypothetical protein